MRGQCQMTKVSNQWVPPPTPLGGGRPDPSVSPFLAVFCARLHVTPSPQPFPPHQALRRVYRAFVLQAAGLENVTISNFSAPVLLGADGGPRDIWKHCALSTPLGVSGDARG